MTAITVPHETERFSFLAWAWDIAKAWALVAASPDRELVEVPVAGPASMLGLIGYDKDWALAHADLSRPLLVIEVPGEDALNMLIDGWHRVARADHEGLAVLPAYLLTVEEEAAIRLR